MENREIKKVLVANRGEIALRVQRACRALGIATVFIASEADKESLFARNAEELVIIGPAPAAQSYLSIEKILAAAKDRGCDAIHPGYGFLSENAEFAQAVRDAGMVFIGPSTEAIRVMGSKTEARKRVIASGVPTTPGAPGGLSDQELTARAGEIGFPVIIKAVAGGGGRGMRIVSAAGEMAEALPRARSEAKKNFANSDVYIEKYISMPRHVEVQLFGDHHGNVVHFGTRDCSAQRRHQKLVEEAPAPFLSPTLREKIHQAAVQAAKSVNYTNAGTAEFLVSGDEFYFLEMNTRIQVEHPVSEAVTGEDLVALQLKVEMGGRVPAQSEIKFSGHAIEFRIYAEDPRAQFRPAVGKLGKFKRPTQTANIREDFGFEAGDEVTPYYDAMLSKLIVTGRDRNEAIARSLEALQQYEITGLPTTVDFHLWLMRNRIYRERCLDIGFLDREAANVPKWIDENKAALVRDPLHRAPVGDAEPVDFLHYRSERFGESYTIEVLHRRDGVFVAAPIQVGGTRAPNRNCRASNGMKTAVQSLISDVLESLPAEQVFS